MKDLVLVYEHPLLDQLCTACCHHHYYYIITLLHYTMIAPALSCQLQLGIYVYSLHGKLQSVIEQTISSHYKHLHTINTLSTQYLHTIYTLSTNFYINT